MFNENDNRVNFVFKKPISEFIKKISKSVDEIHSERTFFYYQLSQLDMTKKYYHDMLPDDFFIYEYNQPYDYPARKFFGKTGFLEMNKCPENVLTRIRQKTALLIISCPFESYLNADDIKLIHEYFKNYDLPVSQIVYFSGCLNGKELYQEYCEANDEMPLFNLEYNIAENLVIHSNLAASRADNKYEKSPKKKTFLMFNRRWHNHRILFLYYIFNRNMSSDFFVSFTDKHIDYPEYTFDGILKSAFDELANDDYIDNNTLTTIKSMLPLYLDTNDFHTSVLMFDQFDMTEWYYSNSFISIVAETYFKGKKLHCTEKTFKPMLFKHPFITMGPPGMLKKIRELGFKTFHDIWDESYDDINDPIERFYKILDLCDSICKWPPIKKHLAIQRCEEIVNHNFNVLLNYNKDKQMILNFLKSYYK